jgi:hypothetical protein
MTFPGGGTAPVGKFSGLYKVLFVANKFSDGQFTQTLQTMRRPKQGSDTNQVSTKDNTGAVSADNPKKQLIKTETNALTGNPEGSSSSTSATDAGSNNGFGNSQAGEFDTTTAPSAGKGKPPVYNTDRRGPQ